MRIMAWGTIAGIVLAPVWVAISVWVGICECWPPGLYLAVVAPMVLGPVLVVSAGIIWDAACEAAELEERFP